MRSDHHLRNDAGALSVVAADAVQAIVADDRHDDEAFVRRHQAMLLTLAGDDPLALRVVVDEPLTADEAGQWLAHSRGRIDAPGGRILICAGFDPRDLEDWQASGHSDHVQAIDVAPGVWDVDVYVHAPSMSGDQLLTEQARDHGGTATWYRRERPGAPLPLWLAYALRFGDDGQDPAHARAWRQAIPSIRAGALAVALEPTSFIGYLVRLSPVTAASPAVDVPAGGWCEFTDGSRALERFPVGLASTAATPALVDFAAEIRAET